MLLSERRRDCHAMTAMKISERTKRQEPLLEGVCIRSRHSLWAAEGMTTVNSEMFARTVFANIREFVPRENNVLANKGS